MVYQSPLLNLGARPTTTSTVIITVPGGQGAYGTQGGGGVAPWWSGGSMGPNNWDAEKFECCGPFGSGLLIGLFLITCCLGFTAIVYLGGGACGLF